jgi:hypothetical protein
LDEALKQKLDLCIENYNTLKSRYKRRIYNKDIVYAACLFAVESKKPDLVGITHMFEYIRKNTGIFSCYRSTLRFSTAVLINAKFNSEPEKSFDLLLKYENELKKAGFKKGCSLAIAVQSLILSCPEDFLVEQVNRVIRIYRKMRTGSIRSVSKKDYSFSVLLSSEEDDTDLLVSRIENIFNMLQKKGFKNTENLSMLSYILSLQTENPEISIEKCRKLYAELKRNGIKINPLNYNTLGILTLIDMETQINDATYEPDSQITNDMFPDVDMGIYTDMHTKKMVFDVVDAIEYLEKYKYFKWCGKDIGILVLSILIINVHINKKISQRNIKAGSAGIPVYSLIAAQKAALISILTAITEAEKG